MKFRYILTFIFLFSSHVISGTNNEAYEKLLEWLRHIPFANQASGSIGEDQAEAVKHELITHENPREITVDEGITESYKVVQIPSSSDGVMEFIWPDIIYLDGNIPVVSVSYTLKKFEVLTATVRHKRILDCVESPNEFHLIHNLKVSTQ